MSLCTCGHHMTEHVHEDGYGRTVCTAVWCRCIRFTPVNPLSRRLRQYALDFTTRRRPVEIFHL